MSHDALLLYIRIASLAVAVFLLLKLFRTGLSRRYPVFSIYLGFRIVTGTLALVVNPKSLFYFYYFSFTEALTLVFYTWVVWELCALVLSKYPGRKSLGRWGILLGVVISLAVSILTMLPRIKPNLPQRSKGIFVLMAADRGVTFALALFLLIMLALFSCFPVRLSRNVATHVTLYTVFFLSNTLSIILISVLGLKLSSAVDAGLLAVSCACLIAWLVLLSRKGDEVVVSLPHFSAGHEERILLQLDTINSTLLKIGKK